MLKEDLLLDSARPFSDIDHNTVGCPEHSSEGVPLSWYVLRVSYSRELKVQQRLDEEGVRSFVPMVWRKREVAGKTTRILVPAISNLCFAYSTRERLLSFFTSYGDASPVHFYWDRTRNIPLVVPEKAMEDFITVASSLDEDLIYLTEINSRLREGQKVIVKDGPFKGVEGKVVRIRKSRRVLVELPGMLAVATTYISPNSLEIAE